jgi:hypothetical protein
MDPNSLKCTKRQNGACIWRVSNDIGEWNSFTSERGLLTAHCIHRVCMLLNELASILEDGPVTVVAAQFGATGSVPCRTEY